jgi:hypothetical protein
VAAALESVEMPSEYNCVRSYFEKEQYTALFRCENIVYETKRITEALSNAGIDHILLKGAIIRDLYPEPWMRTSCDIDVLIREECLDEAIRALTESLGYSYDGNRNYHDVSLYSSSGVHLELHFSIKENIEKLDSLLTRVWEYSSPVENSNCYKQSNEFFQYHIIAHAAYHFISGGCGIRPILDLWLIKNKTKFDEEILYRFCEEAGVSEFYSAVSALADAWFSGQNHTEITEKMQEYILTGGVYGTQRSRIAAKHEVKGGYVWSRIWISYDHLKSRYPSLKCKLFIPFYQVRRWFEFLLKGKLKKGVKEIKIDREIDSETVSEISELMHNIGLDKYIK